MSSGLSLLSFLCVYFLNSSVFCLPLTCVCTFVDIMGDRGIHGAGIFHGCWALNSGPYV